MINLYRLINFTLIYHFLNYFFGRIFLKISLIFTVNDLALFQDDISPICHTSSTHWI